MEYHHYSDVDIQLLLDGAALVLRHGNASLSGSLRINIQVAVAEFCESRPNRNPVVVRGHRLRILTGVSVLAALTWVLWPPRS